jgi:arylsulfatase A-like enzyme
MYNGKRFPESVPLISEVLSEQDYRTAGFVSGNPNLVPDFGYADGFDTYIDFISNASTNGSTLVNTSSSKNTSSASNSNGLIDQLASQIKNNDMLRTPAERLYLLFRYRMLEPLRKARNYARFLQGHTPNALSSHTSQPAEELVNLALDWLTSEGDSSRPVFLWVHLMDPHSWYDPAPEYMMEMFDTDLPRLSRLQANRSLMSASPFRGDPDIDSVKSHISDLEKLYDASIRQVDSAVGELVDNFVGRTPGETSVILTADHGEQFLEHGGVQHGPHLYDELLRVPLIVYGDGISPGKFEQPVQLMDLPPTIAEIAGSSVPDQYQGDSLAPVLHEDTTLEDRIIVSAISGNDCVSVRDERYSYLTYKDSRDDEFYDRATDPAEQHPSTEINEAIRDQFESVIAEYQRLTEPPVLSSGSVEISEEIQSRLEDLGYS